jgi:UDP-N-acetyl-D-mannosaminuronic acid dehydrogenase
MDKRKSMKIAVIGIGRVGLPLAILLADKGHRVIGIGRDPKKIAALKLGLMPFKENGAEPLLKKHIGKKFFPTTDYSYINLCDYIVLTLGTPIDENMNPNVKQIEVALEAAMPYLKKGQTLILRSTVSPNTTEYIQRLLEKHFRVGKDFFLAFCPERILEGNAIEELQEIPQVIGGINKESSERAELLFVSLGIECLLTDPLSAELSKLFTNMYRYINFAVANEFMILASNYGRDIYKITNLVNHKYLRNGLKLPGFSAGPCLFKDGFFLIADLPFADLISTSWRINETVPLLLVKQVCEKKKVIGKKVALLGAAFKAETDDIRQSLSFKVKKSFIHKGADVTMHDPFVQSTDKYIIEQDLHKTLKGADVVFVATNHEAYTQLHSDTLKKLIKKDAVICDIWNVFGIDKILFSAKDL